MATRVWDRFLTEQDKKLAAKLPRTAYGFGRRPALLLVDLYRWVYGDRPEPLLKSVERWPGSCGTSGWDAIPATKRLLTAARGAEIPIAYVTGMYPESSGVIGWSNRGTTRISSRQGKADDENKRRRYEIVDELKPLPGEAVLNKTAPSAFFGTPLAAHFTGLGVDTVITCGESTSGCVRASVVDGRSLSYRMIVVEECVFDRTEASHAINLFDMDQKYADVLPLSEVLDYLQGLKRQAVVVGQRQG